MNSFKLIAVAAFLPVIFWCFRYCTILPVSSTGFSARSITAGTHWPIKPLLPIWH